MNIKIKLAFKFTLVVAGILLFFSALVYYFSYTSQVSKFRENLLKRATNTGIMLMDLEEVDSLLLKKIHQSTITWSEEEIALTDTNYRLIYSNNLQLLMTADLSKYASENGKNFFSINLKDGIFLKHSGKSKNYYVFVLAYDNYRDEKLSDLLGVLFWSIIFSLWLAVLFSYWFSRKAIQPISEIVAEMKEINSSRLNKRLNIGSSRDEIDQLSLTFNEMLSELEIAFRNQADFVSNASHELRTPISVMIAETDYCMSKQREKKEYVDQLTSMLSDLRHINLLLNSLLELAHLNKHNDIQLNLIRIDEILLEAIRLVKAKFPERNLLNKIQYPDDDSKLWIMGNEGMLEIAFRNLMDNACKFSTKDVKVVLEVSEQFLILRIIDDGIGIPEQDLDHILQPFRRGSNAVYKGGFGIGLSLVNRILELHHAKLIIESKINEGSTFSIHFQAHEVAPTT